MRWRVSGGIVLCRRPGLGGSKRTADPETISTTTFFCGQRVERVCPIDSSGGTNRRSVAAFHAAVNNFTASGIVSMLHPIGTEYTRREPVLTEFFTHSPTNNDPNRTMHAYPD